MDVWWDATGRLDPARTLPLMNLHGRVIMIAGLQHTDGFRQAPAPDPSPCDGLMGQLSRRLAAVILVCSS